MVEDRDVSPRVRTMLHSIESDSVLVQELLRHLDTHQRCFAAAVRKHLCPPPLLSQGELDIIQTPAGYAATKDAGGSVSRFTNFLLEITASVWFEATQELYFRGRLLMDGNSIYFLISDQEVLQPKAIVLRARRAVYESKLKVQTPTILDPSLEQQLVAILSVQLGGQPKVPGVQRLGWNEGKTRFAAPAWAADADGLQATSRIIHPEAQVVSAYFTTEPCPTAEGDLSQVTPQARYLIALLIASLVRGFLNQPTPLVNIQRSVPALAMLQAVFRPLGQKAPVELNPDRGQVLRTLSPRNLSRYPLFVTCPDPSVLEKVSYPLFLVGDCGLALPAPLETQALRQISSLAHRLVSTVVLKLLREPLHAHAHIPNQPGPSPDELALEGQRIIETLGGMGKFELLNLDLPLLQGILSRIALPALPDYFSFEPETGLIHIRCRQLQGLTRKPLYQELLAKCPQVRLRGSHYISCPADWLKQVLENFYGQPVVLSASPGTKAAEK
jgi:hypothetical protein